MPSPFVFAKWEGLLLLAGFFGIVFCKLANGSIVLEQLFEGDIRDKNPENADGYSSYVSAGRVQSFLVTVFVALYYLLQVIQNPTELQKLPADMIGALAGSHALYLGGKAQAMLFGPLRDFLK
jgi:hypothetical protein